MRIRPSVALLLSFSFFTPVFATLQQQTGAPPSAPAPAGRKQDKRDPVDDAVVRVAVDLVQVDVVVTDQKGQHVTNLNAEDFEVFEEGRKQEVRNFSYVSTDGSAEPGDNGRSTSTSTPSTRPLNSSTDVTNSRRTIALVVDDLGISFESMVSVREALRKFVAQQMLPTDQVAIITTSKRIGALEQFTSDKRQLQRTIDNIQFYPGGHAGLSPFEQPQQQLADPTEVPELASKSAQTINDLEAERAANYTVGTFGTLNFVMQGLGQMPGRKTVMLFAESFRLFTNQGRNARLFENLQRLTEQANLASTVIYTTDASGLNPLSMTASDKVLGLSYTFDPRTVGDFRTGSARSIRSAAAPSLREIARQEGGSSAAFKDLEELMNLRDTQNIESQTVLSYLAQQTGGLFTRNTNNLTLGTERMLDDQKGFYLIGYRPHESVIDPATGRRRYRDLTVKLKRSSLRLRSRDGYYGVTREEARKTRRTREEQIAAALTSPFAAGGMDMRMTPLFFNDQSAGSYMRALLHVNSQDLTFTEETDGSHQTAVDILAVNFGEGGRVVDQYNDTQTIKVPAAAYEKILRDGLSFVLNIPVKQPGSYQLHLALRDTGSERVGAAGQYIEVPDLTKNRLVLSGIVLSGARAVRNIAASASDSLTAQEQPEMQFSPALRRIRQGMTLKYDYLIYNAQADAATGQPRLETQMRLFRDGKQVYAGTQMGLDASKQSDLKRLSASGRIRIGLEYSPGAYVLQVIITETGAKNKSRALVTTQSTDFEVVN